MDQFDAFSIYFVDGSVRIGTQTYPLGQTTTDVLNWDAEELGLLKDRCEIKINEEGAISEFPTFLTKLLGIKEEEYESRHLRTLDKMPITLHHLFFDFAA